MSIVYQRQSGLLPLCHHILFKYDKFVYEHIPIYINLPLKKITKMPRITSAKLQKITQALLVLVITFIMALVMVIVMKYKYVVVLLQMPWLVQKLMQGKIGRFCLMMEFHWGWSSTNGATSSSFNMQLVLQYISKLTRELGKT